jgi:hypothetical protein
VCPASTRASDRLARLAGDTRLLAVLVAEGADHASAAALAGRLRAAGADVAIVVASEVEAWFANGCVAS